MGIKLDFSNDSPLTQEMRKKANQALYNLLKDIQKQSSERYWSKVNEFYEKETLDLIKEKPMKLRNGRFYTSRS
jgi:hypothetical protein